eukprot:scaffold141303_cov31-Prasinocladus_malaysianus.AAC.1
MSYDKQVFQCVHFVGCVWDVLTGPGDPAAVSPADDCGRAQRAGDALREGPERQPRHPEVHRMRADIGGRLHARLVHGNSSKFDECINYYK